MHHSRSSLDPSTFFRTQGHVLVFPQWRLPLSSTRLTTITCLLFAIVLLLPQTSAAPLEHRNMYHFGKRQTVPDRFGNAGNERGPVASQPPTRPAAPTETLALVTSTSPLASAATTSLDIASSFLALPSSTQLITSSSPKPTPPNGRPEEQLQRTNPESSLTPGTIAGIAGGAALVTAIFIGIAWFVYRRRRQREIQEIPIRHSKLVSRLGMRMFGSSRDAFRSPSAASKYTTRSSQRVSSQRGSSETAKEVQNAVTALNAGSRLTPGSVPGLLDKASIGRPRPAYVHTSSQFLELPRPLFADRERQIGKTGETLRRPERPLVDAAPLGRLSGMGFGLGLGRTSWLE